MPGGWVSERNTSSSRPDSRCSSGTSQSFLTMTALTAGSALAPGFGTAVSRSSRASDSTAGDFRKQRDFAARRLELLGLLEAQADGVVVARARFERARRLVGDDAAVGDDDGAGAHLVHLLQDVGRHDDQLVLAELVDQAAHFVFLIRVEAVGRLVQDQHLRIVDQRLREADAAPESLGQGFDDLVDDRGRARAGR